jgi:hypothetical protein
MGLYYNWTHGGDQRIKGSFMDIMNHVLREFGGKNGVVVLRNALQKIVFTCAN